MNKLDQRGTGIIELLLLIVIVGLLGFTGWYVWNSRQKTDKTLEQTSSSTSASEKSNQQATNAQTTGLYSPPGKEFTVRLADGWKLNHCNGTAFLYTYNHDDVILKQGVKPVVTDVTCGSDGGGDGLDINFVKNPDEAAVSNPQTGTFTTVAGDTVKAYSRVESGDAWGEGAVQKGGVYYNYIITKSPTKIMRIDYGVNPGQADEHKTVEDVVKSIVIN